jgi:predicted NBD/HSP70 family sugar kinase
VVNLVDLSTVVLGGLYTLLEPWLRAPFAEELRARVVGQRWSRVRVLTTRLGSDAAVRGAAGAVVREILSNPAALLGSATRSST